MVHIASRAALIIAFGASAASILYVLWAVWAVAAFRRRIATAKSTHQPVTILKPVCGIDSGLYANLRSFCEQDYPTYEVIFGVRDAQDPAIPVVERIIRELPERDLSLVVDGRVIGTNLKVSNLANMYAKAKYDTLVIADSDMIVQPDYLASVVASFESPEVGAVTCLYKGSAVGGFSSVLGCMFINDWFAPSVLVARSLGSIRFCFGATMAVRRSVLEEIGGFPALASHLADDYMLGNLVAERGYKVELAPYIVENIVLEPNFKSLLFHELRWARTVRSVQPVGYAFSFLTNAVPVSVVFLLMSHLAMIGIVTTTTAVMARILLHYVVRGSLGVRGPAVAWLVPFRGVLSLAVWGCGLFGRNVRWRGQEFAVGADGRLAAKGSV